MSDRFSVDQSGFERHYTATELAKMWHVAANTVRKLFENEPGVFKFGLMKRRGKRTLTSLRIPAHVAQRVYERHIQKAS